MLKKRIISIILVAIFVIFLVVDNIPRDYRNLDKLEEYNRVKESILSEHPDIIKKLMAEGNDAKALTEGEILEMNEVMECLTVKCASIEELRDYEVMSNRLARTTKRKIFQQGEVIYCLPGLD